MAQNEENLALQPIGNEDQHENPAAEEAPQELLPRVFERTVLTIDPKLIANLVHHKTLGYARPVNQLLTNVRYYTLNITNFRTAITEVLTAYMSKKLYESEQMTDAEVDAEITTVVPIVTNACMAALYSKLRTIHTSYQTYSTRFNTRPTYTKEIELPLPLAEAIDNLGVFTPSNTLEYVTCAPVIPEGLQNEGRSAQNWNSQHYQAYIPVMKDYGIPMKSVDTRLKNGNAWWTFKVSHTNHTFDFRCIYPPANYSENAAMIATMFARINAEGEIQPIITHLDTDVDYPYRLREIPEGYHVRAFAAYCQALNMRFYI